MLINIIKVQKIIVKIKRVLNINIVNIVVGVLINIYGNNKNNKIVLQNKNNIVKIIQQFMYLTNNLNHNLYKYYVINYKNK
jgi:hypothetical protein